MGTFLGGDSDRIRLEPANIVPRQKWSDPTILDEEFKHPNDFLGLIKIVKYFGVHRSEAELDQFLQAVSERFPPHCQWIWPLLPLFRRSRGENVVLLLLQCPLRDKYLANNTKNPTFTGEFVTGLAKCKYSPPIPLLS